MTIDYQGSGYYQASTESITVTANPLETEIELGLDMASSTYGDVVTATVTIGAGSATTLPSGTITLFDGQEQIATAESAGAQTEITLSELDAGTHALTATFTPADLNLASTATSDSSPLSVSALAVTPEVTLGQDSISYGDSISGSVSANAFGQPVAGTVQVSVGENTVEASPVEGGGWTFTLPTTGVGVGTATVTATLTTTSGNYAGQSGAAELGIDVGVSHADVSVDAQAINVGDDVTVTVTVPEATTGEEVTVT